MTLDRIRKLWITVALFALATVLVALAGAVGGVGPLFAAWIPLLAVTWLLTRPEPGDVLAPGTTETDEPGPPSGPDD